MLSTTFLLFAAASSSFFLNVHAHGTITAVKGANGVQAAGFGIIESTPRDGSRAKPFQQDTSVIRDREIASGKTGVCGRTSAGGNNDVAAQLAAASAAGLPTAGADGSVQMTLHQVNQDGAGPFTCDVSGDGTNFTPATVTTDVPGRRGLSFSKAQDFPLVAQMPAGVACTAGPNGDACIMRCRNQALAGPFGSCVAVASGDAAAGNAAAGNATAGNAAAGNAAAAAGNANAATGAAAGNAAAGNAAAAAGNVNAATGATAVAPAAGAAKKGGLAGLFAGLRGKAGNGAAKRYIVSRVAGKRSGYWLDNQ
ncbi:hypothetical protein C8J57DRAFT_25321 [Mycena rebaudengoi]|nr:hypothetical protein C8J57DRAFT_25321 [Mycena rebaudengoi]